MRLTLHIVRKDLVRMRLPMALWAACFLWEFAIGLRTLHGPAPDLNVFLRLTLYGNVAYWIQAVVGYVLIAALIHEDPLVGTTAFWPTRPISGARLLGAKLAGYLVIFGAFPALVTLPWWLCCGYGVHEVFWAALDTFCLGVMASTVGLTIAALTGDMSRYIAGMLLVVVLLAISLMVFVKLDPIFPQLKDAAHKWVDSGPRIRGLACLFLLGFAAVAAHQYLTRRLARSLAMLGCILGVLIYECAQPPLDEPHFSQFAADATLPVPAPDTTDRFAVELADAHIVNEPSRGVELPVPAFLTLRVEGVPPDRYLFFTGSDVEWKWPDGTHFEGKFLWPQQSGGHTPPRPFPGRPAPREWWDWMRAHGHLNWAGGPDTYEEYVDRWNARPSELWSFIVAIPQDVVAKMRTSTPSCTLDLKASIVRFDPRPETPLAPGSGWDESAEGLHVQRMAWDAKRFAMDVAYVEHHPALGSLFNLKPDAPHVSPYIFSRRREESAQFVDGNNIETMRIGSVSISWVETWFGGPAHWTSADKWSRETTPDWFSDASITGSVGTVVGLFEKKMAIEKFAPRLEKPRN